MTPAKINDKANETNENGRPSTSGVGNKRSKTGSFTPAARNDNVDQEEMDTNSSSTTWRPQERDPEMF